MSHLTRTLGSAFTLQPVRGENLCALGALLFAFLDALLQLQQAEGGGPFGLALPYLLYLAPP